MKRKLVKQGNSALTVTLPASWTKKKGLKAGDEVEMDIFNEEVCISSQTFIRKEKNITLNIENFNRITLTRHLHEFYRSGAQQFTLFFSNNNLLDPKTGKNIQLDEYLIKLIDRFIGMEITSQTDNKVIITNMIESDSEEKLEVIFNRIYFLLKEFLEMFISSFDSDFSVFEKKIPIYHDNLSKFTYYYLRILNISSLPEDQKFRMCGLLINVDKIIDNLRYAATGISTIIPLTKQFKEFISKLFYFFLEHFSIVNKEAFSLEKLDRLIKQRYDFLKVYKSNNFSNKEKNILNNLRSILDMMNDFNELYAALHHTDYIVD